MAGLDINGWMLWFVEKQIMMVTWGTAYLESLAWTTPFMVIRRTAVSLVRSEVTVSELLPKWEAVTLNYGTCPGRLLIRYARRFVINACWISKTHMKAPLIFLFVRLFWNPLKTCFCILLTILLKATGSTNNLMIISHSSPAARFRRNRSETRTSSQCLDSKSICAIAVTVCKMRFYDANPTAHTTRKCC